MADEEIRTPEQKKKDLYDKQVELLKTFRERNAISQAQYDKSFHDLTVKMGYEEKKEEI